MGDERLRELERRWELTGTAADGRRCLQARVRAGVTTWPRLAFAAHLGAPEVARVLAVRPWVPASTAKQLKRWCLRLARFGREVQLRVAHAAVAVASAQAEVPAITALVGAAAEQLDCPCAVHGVALGVARDALEHDGRPRWAAAQALAALLLAPPTSAPAPWPTLAAAADALPEDDRWSRLQGAIAVRLLPWARGDSSPS